MNLSIESKKKTTEKSIDFHRRQINFDRPSVSNWVCCMHATILYFGWHFFFPSQRLHIARQVRAIDKFLTHLFCLIFNLSFAHFETLTTMRATLVVSICSRSLWLRLFRHLESLLTFCTTFRSDGCLSAFHFLFICKMNKCVVVGIWFSIWLIETLYCVAIEFHVFQIEQTSNEKIIDFLLLVICVICVENSLLWKSKHRWLGFIDIEKQQSQVYICLFVPWSQRTVESSSWILEKFFYRVWRQRCLRWQFSPFICCCCWCGSWRNKQIGETDLIKIVSAQHPKAQSWANKKCFWPAASQTQRQVSNSRVKHHSDYIIFCGITSSQVSHERAENCDKIIRQRTSRQLR